MNCRFPGGAYYFRDTEKRSFSNVYEMNVYLADNPALLSESVYERPKGKTGRKDH